MHVRLRVLAVWTLKVLVFLRRVVQDDFRHPLVESFLSVVALNLLQPAVVSLGVLRRQRWAHGSITFSETLFSFVLLYSIVCISATHRNQNAVEILLLVLVLVAVRGGAQQLLEPTQSPNPEDGEIVLVEEGLHQREVDLQSHVVCVVGRQQAQDRAVRIAALENRT